MPPPAHFIVTPWVRKSVAQPSHHHAAGAIADAQGHPDQCAPRIGGAGRGEGVSGGNLFGRRPGAYPGAAQRVPGRGVLPDRGVEPGNVAAFLAAGAAFVRIARTVDEKRIAAGDRASIEARRAG